MTTYKIGAPEYDHEGYEVYDDDRRDEGVPARIVSGVTAGQAIYALALLDAGADPDDIEEMVR